MIENIVIARKLTVLEYEAKKYGYSIDESVEKFKQAGADGEKVLASHYRQLETFTKISQSLDNPVVVNGDEVDKNLLHPESVILAIGGDNYFQHISHFLENQLIVGINSDPETSSGSLLQFSADGFLDFLPRLKNGEFDIKEWVRLQAIINGGPVETQAISEIYLGAYKSTDMSRYLLDYPDQFHPQRIIEHDLQKSSGIIVATASAGLTGWYRSAAHISYPDYVRKFQKAFYTVREMFDGIHDEGDIFPEEKITITWQAHGDGLVSIDCQDEHIIKRGDKVEIQISNQPLRVVSP